MKISHSMPSTISLQMQSIKSVVSKAQSAGKPSADFILKDDNLIAEVAATYGKDAVTVTPSQAKHVSVRV